MASFFPSGQDTWTAKVDAVTTIFASHVNDLQNAVASLEIGGVSVQTIAYAASITPNVVSGELVAVGTLTGNITINNATNVLSARLLRFLFTQDSTGGRTVTWGSAYNTSWQPDSGASKKSSITFYYDGTKWQALSTASTVVAATVLDAAGALYNVKHPLYGAKGDAVSDVNLAITNATAILTTTTSPGPFKAADAAGGGKIIDVAGAGTAGAVLQAKIIGFTNSQSVTLDTNAGTTVTGARGVWATQDDVAAIAAAITAAQTAGGGTIGGSGHYMLRATSTAASLRWHFAISGDNVVFDDAQMTLMTVQPANTFFINGGGKPAGMANVFTYAFASTAPLYAISAVAKSALTITTTLASDAGNFVIGDWIFIKTGEVLAISTTSEPDSEINQVTSVNAGTGVIGLRWPAAKPYVQEYWLAGPTGPTVAVDQGAGSAPFGVCKVTDRIGLGIALKKLRFFSATATTAVVAGGQLYDFRLEDCSSDHGGAFHSMGNFRAGRLVRNTTLTSGDNVYHLSAATGCTDVLIEDNVGKATGMGICHIHEGAAQVKTRNNKWLNGGSASVCNAISVRARAYDIDILGDTIVNGSTDASSPGVYVDNSCGGSGMGGSIRGLLFAGTFSTNGGSLTVSPTSGWSVGPNSSQGTNAYESVALGNDWDQAEIAFTAGDMALHAGAPVQVLVAGNRFIVWDVRHGFQDSVDAGVRVPRTWKGYALSLYWINESAGAGNVKWNIFAWNRAIGQTLNVGPDLNTTQTIAAGSQYILTATTFASISASGNDLNIVTIQRDGTAGADTLAGTAGIAAIVIRRTA